MFLKQNILNFKIILSNNTNFMLYFLYQMLIIFIFNQEKLKEKPHSVF